MVLPEKQAFIPDSALDIPVEKRNAELSAWLIQAPYVNWRIIRIERKEDNLGWYIYYTE